jgi:competence protein ComEA
MKLFTQRQYVALFVLCLLLAGAAAYRLPLYRWDATVLEGGRGQEPARFVYGVYGSVRHPGYYCFREEATLARIIETAGGLGRGVTFTESVLSDVPGNGSAILVRGDGVLLEPMGVEERLVFHIAIDVNSVSEKELIAIPGIGEKLAQRIVAYRQSKGSIRTIDELKAVPGIGERRLSLLRRFFKRPL